MRLLLILCFVLSIINGCGPLPGKLPPDQIEAEQQADNLILASNFAAAAEKYLQLAGQYRHKSDFYKLKAVEAYIRDDNYEHAAHILDTIVSKQLTPALQLQRKILHAWIALAKDDPGLALELLTGKLPAEATPDLLADYAEVRALAFEQNKQYLDVINERIALSNYLDSSDELNENYNLLWSVISQLDVDTINSYRETSPGVVASWLELGIINKTMLSSRKNLNAAIDTWAERFPGHPALNEIVPNMLALSGQLNLIPRQIALLLPMTPKYREASIAIQEGFMAAWYEQEINQPLIKVYNADAQNILKTYQLAVEEGAEFIIGPLEKEAVATLVENNEITVRTMVLNHYDGNSMVNTDVRQAAIAPLLIQFALSPEDEARQVAERAWFEGHANALIITPATAWGERIFNAFNSQWEKFGGRILERISLEHASQDFSTPIKQILNIDTSEQRAKLLRSKLNRRLHTESRRRQDADFIFVAATPNIGRQLIPQLRFHRADDLNVYSISNIYSGTPNTRADSDMNNVIFLDMPWVIDPERGYSSIQRTLSKYGKLSETIYKRLYAFGIDAFSLIPQLGDLAANTNKSYAGETGLLKLDPTGKLQRRLIWAKFVNGKPELIDMESIH